MSITIVIKANQNSSRTYATAISTRKDMVNSDVLLDTEHILCLNPFIRVGISAIIIPHPATAISASDDTTLVLPAIYLFVTGEDDGQVHTVCVL